MSPDSFESEQEALDPHRREEREGVKVELQGRIAQKGVALDGSETVEELDDLLAAIDRFEYVVEARGGDLMVNSPQSSPPENPGFVLPRRRGAERVVSYTERVNSAAEAVERGQR